ncbi:MAG TPA: Coenzyme F420 hydrogenase/dehydrogenase, beta subunit C-terminal domain [Flavisolibacter sp.]
MNHPLSPKDIVRSDLCIGCGSCVGQAGLAETRMKFDAYGFIKPSGPVEWYNKPSERFSQTCPFSPTAPKEDQLMAELFPDATQGNAATGRFQDAYVGHVSEDEFRTRGSSGGMVSWVAVELLRKGLVDGVAHVVASSDPQEDGNYFHYTISRTEAEIAAGAKSRYYPIELSKVLQTIRDVPGRYAVVGVPCFIKAVQLLRRADPLFRERIRFTLGLFCGHMKSARFVESFAWQMKVPVEDVKQVEFRHKYPERPAYIYNAMLTIRDGRVVNRDWKDLADGDWGAGYFMNSACNFCDDVVAETADVSFGDAWVEPYAADGRGTNVVIVRSEIAAKALSEGIAEGRLALKTVDAEFVERTQTSGLRMRREGLAYRLTWAKKGVQPVKRVPPDAQLPKTRKLVYRMRQRITVGSHRMSRLARTMKLPALYILWAKIAGTVYQKAMFYKTQSLSFLYGMGAVACALLVNLALFLLLQAVPANNMFSMEGISIGKVLMYTLIISVPPVFLFMVLPKITSRPVPVFYVLYGGGLLVLLTALLLIRGAFTSYEWTLMLFCLIPALLVWILLPKSVST